jgi:hypothetical protein
VAGRVADAIAVAIPIAIHETRRHANSLPLPHHTHKPCNHAYNPLPFINISLSIINNSSHSIDNAHNVINPDNSAVNNSINTLIRIKMIPIQSIEELRPITLAELEARSNSTRNLMVEYKAAIETANFDTKVRNYMVNNADKRVYFELCINANYDIHVYIPTEFTI